MHPETRHSHTLSSVQTPRAGCEPQPAFLRAALSSEMETVEPHAIGTAAVSGPDARSRGMHGQEGCTVKRDQRMGSAGETPAWAAVSRAVRFS